jgi:hypothetical protein
MAEIDHRTGDDEHSERSNGSGRLRRTKHAHADIQVVNGATSADMAGLFASAETAKLRGSKRFVQARADMPGYTSDVMHATSRCVLVQSSLPWTKTQRLGSNLLTYGACPG